MCNSNTTVNRIGEKEHTKYERMKAVMKVLSTVLLKSHLLPVRRTAELMIVLQMMPNGIILMK